MANPHPIRYATTEDGVSIAFWTAGQGKPVVMVHSFALSHADLEWSVPSLARFYTQLARDFMLVRLDPRGSGMSGDPPHQWGLESADGGQLGMSSRDMGLDIEAVVRALGIERFVLLAVSTLAPIALHFAVRHPPMVSELILWNGMADVASSHMAETIALWQAIMGAVRDPTHNFMLSYGEWAFEGEVEAVRTLMGTQVARRWGKNTTKLQLAWNVEGLLPEVVASTLVVCSSPGLAETELVADSRHLAATIPGAELRTLSSSTANVHWSPEALSELRRFLGTGDAESGLRTVVVTDIIGSTEFLAQVGDDVGRAAIRELERRIADVASARNGRVIKNLGDGSLVMFRSNSNALDFALDVQSGSEPSGLSLRVGVSVGEPLQEDGDIHGMVVAQASRVADVAEAGEVAVSDGVHQLAVGKRFQFVLKGDFDLKGFAEPCRIWTVCRSGPQR